MQVSFDRFTPYRGYRSFEVSTHNISHCEEESVSDIPFDEKAPDPESKPRFINTAKHANNIINYRKALKSAMGVTDSKVLKYSATRGRKGRQVMGENRNSWPVLSRKEPLMKSPETVLDMPDIDTTTFRHVTDWGKQGQIATIFHGEVHLWVSPNSQLACTQTNKTVLECVKWNHTGTKFAVARYWSKISIVDAETLKIERTIHCKCLQCVITAIEWSKTGTIIAGCSSGSVICAFQHCPQILYFYRLLNNEIIDLKLSCNESYLLINTMRGPTAIFNWPINLSSHTPAMVFTTCDGNHGYIRSTSWHPWKESLLAVGETYYGTKIWNVNNQKVVDQGIIQPYFKKQSMLDCLTFNPLSAELLVSFYYEDPDPHSDEGPNFLTVFKDLKTRVDEIQFHRGRVPHILWDGTGTKFATVGTDENLVIWDFFGKDAETEKRVLGKKKKKVNTDIFETSKSFNTCIR